MRRGRAWSSGTAAAALTGVVLTGGATLGAGDARAASVAPRPPVPPICTIGTTTYLQPPVRSGSVAATTRPAVAADGAGRCVDAISQDLLVLADVVDHALVRLPAKPKPAVPKPAVPKPVVTPAPTTTTTAPRPVPATTVPATSVPATSVPATSVPATSVPATSVPATSVPATSAPRPAPAPTVPAVPTTVGAAAFPATPSTPAAGPAPVVRAASAAPPAVAPPTRAVTAPAAQAGADPLAVAGGAPVGAAVVPASYLDPLGAPGIGALPGEPTILQTLGGDTAGVTTSSRVQALGLGALHQGGGVPAVLGVTVIAGLGGAALRHRILQRIRSTAPADGPEPERDEVPTVAGRHAR